MNKHLSEYKHAMQEKTESKDYDENTMREFDAFVNSLELDKKVIQFHTVRILSMIN